MGDVEHESNQGTPSSQHHWSLHIMASKSGQSMQRGGAAASPRQPDAAALPPLLQDVASVVSLGEHTIRVFSFPL